MVDLGHPCPLSEPGNVPPCPTRLQPVTFEGHASLAAGIAGHLQTVHGWTLQNAWRAANRAAVLAGQE